MLLTTLVFVYWLPLLPRLLLNHFIKTLSAVHLLVLTNCLPIVLIWICHWILLHLMILLLLKWTQLHRSFHLHQMTIFFPTLLKTVPFLLPIDLQMFLWFVLMFLFLPPFRILMVTII